MSYFNFSFKPYNSKASTCVCTYCNKRKKKNMFAPSAWHNSVSKYRRCRVCTSILNKKRRERLKQEDPDGYREAEREKRLKYIASNPEKYRESRRKIEAKRRKKNPDKFRIKGIGSQILKNAKKRGIKFEMEPHQLRDWILNQEQKCDYCGSTLNKIKRYYKKVGKYFNDKRLTLDRKNNDQGYTFQNITLSCRICNDHKSDFFEYDDFKIIAKKYIKKEIEKKLKD